MSEPKPTGALGEALAEISNALVGLHKRFYGKGPVRAKTFLVDNTVLCLLEGGFTIVERTLIDIGRDEVVRDLRHNFQLAMQEQFTQVVEDQLDRRVVAYLSQVHTDPDIAVELFMLEPTGRSAIAEHEQEFPADDGDAA
ncbi:MAG TPA: Na-translocating system protein MpsC family protein [Solirubrobacteraceae bacterium]